MDPAVVAFLNEGSVCYLPLSYITRKRVHVFMQSSFVKHDSDIELQRAFVIYFSSQIYRTLEFFAKNTPCNRHQFQKFQKNTQIYHGILL